MSIIAWRDIEWSLIETQVFRLQRRIYIASLQNNRDKVHFLQKRLISSIGAKLLSVRCVTQFNKRKKTISLDYISGLTNKEKVSLAKNLKIKKKTSSIQIVKKKTLCNLGILKLKDQCLQQLVKFALEPEWEAKFEANSYGFRPGRSCHDAIQAIFIQSIGRSLYVFEANISKCFETISHSKLLHKLNTFSVLEDQIHAWLSVGLLDICLGEKDTSLLPNTHGLFQGEIISPLLVNIALHGLETDVKNYYINNFCNGSIRNRTETWSNQVPLIRYGNNFVVLASDEQKICKLKIFISRWLHRNMNLDLSKGNIFIRNSLDGYSFLGFHIITIKRGDKFHCKIHISKESKKKLISKVRKIVRNNRAISSEKLIYILNSLVLRWCNYFKFSECGQDFKQVEYAIFGILRSWIFRRKSKGLKSRTKIKLKYFPKDTLVNFQGHEHKGSWIFSKEVVVNNRKTNVLFLVWPSWISREIWVKIHGVESPYNGNNIYWAKRNPQYCNWNKTTTQLVRMQLYKCAICHKLFDARSRIEKNYIVPSGLGGKNIIKNLQAVHDFCRLSYSKN